MRHYRASHTREIRAGIASLLLLFAGAGCIFRQSTVVSRFSGEFVCPESQVKIEKVDKERFRAIGCNRRALYKCSGEYGELCERIGQPETIQPTTEETPPERGGEPAAS